MRDCDQESFSFWSKNNEGKESDGLMVKILKILVKEPSDSLYRYARFWRLRYIVLLFNVCAWQRLSGLTINRTTLADSGLLHVWKPFCGVQIIRIKYGPCSQTWSQFNAIFEENVIFNMKSTFYFGCCWVLMMDSVNNLTDWLVISNVTSLDGVGSCSIDGFDGTSPTRDSAGRISMCYFSTGVWGYVTLCTNVLRFSPEASKHSDPLTSDFPVSGFG